MRVWAQAATMSNMLDSVPTFKARAAAVGISTECIGFLTTAGISTLGNLAYASSSQPGQGDDLRFQEVIVGAYVRAVTAGELSSVRRLWFEAHTVAIAEIRDPVERHSEDAPRRIPIHERTARSERQRLKCPGLRIQGPLEPSLQVLFSAAR